MHERTKEEETREETEEEEEEEEDGRERGSICSDGRMNMAVSVQAWWMWAVR